MYDPCCDWYIYGSAWTLIQPLVTQCPAGSLPDAASGACEACVAAHVGCGRCLEATTKYGSCGNPKRLRTACPISERELSQLAQPSQLAQLATVADYRRGLISLHPQCAPRARLGGVATAARSERSSA